MRVFDRIILLFECSIDLNVAGKPLSLPCSLVSAISFGMVETFV